MITKVDRWAIMQDDCEIGLAARTITKTRLYNFDPLKSQFFTVKLGFTGVNIIFLILLKTIIVSTHYNRLAVAVLMNTHNLYLRRHMKSIRIFFYLKVFLLWAQLFKASLA